MTGSGRMARIESFILFILSILVILSQPADATIKTAFAFLYALPEDTAAAPMGSWVIDTEATAKAFDASGEWRIVVTKLTDTGDGLQFRELAGKPGTSPAQLAETAAAIQALEAEVSKAEAEASLEVTVATGDAAAPSSVAKENGWNTIAVAGASEAARRQGHWVGERWSAATLFVRIGNVTVTAQGNQEMLDRVVKETRWEMFR
jgi:hypothetical protein